MIKSNKPRNSREGERERDVAPTKPSRAPKAVAPPPHAAAAAGTHRHGPDTRHPAPVLGTRYPAPAHAAAPLRPRGPALAALPTEKLRLSPLFFPPFLSLFSLSFLSSFFLWHGGGESGVAFRQGRAERSPLASARPSSSTAAQRSGESAPGRDGTAPHGITARPAPLRGSAGNAAGAALGADAEPLPRFRAV